MFVREEGRECATKAQGSTSDSITTFPLLFSLSLPVRLPESEATSFLAASSSHFPRMYLLSLYFSLLLTWGVTKWGVGQIGPESLGIQAT